MKCEICKRFDEQWELKDTLRTNGVSYHVCSNCLVGLVNLELKPEEFKQILKSGHTVEEYLLHEDFYDEDTGEALQPRGS